MMKVCHFPRGIIRQIVNRKLQVSIHSTRRDPGFVFGADNNVLFNILGTNQTSKLTFYIGPPCRTIIILCPIGQGKVELISSFKQI